MSYVPRPKDTSAVVPPEALHALMELLAENAHDLWASRKLADGWSYGPTVDPVARTHPDLVAYDQLPEEKKAYDRDMAMGTIKLILSLGYEIVPPSA
jgi:hypothetical protein